MSRTSPFLDESMERGAELFVYGAAAAGSAVLSEAREPDVIRMVSHFGEIESEYAAIRKSAGLLDRPDRGTIVLTGADRHDFLNRLLTNELKGIGDGRVVRSFWLNRKGRIDADLTLGESDDRLVIDLDATIVEATCRSWEEFLFTEDVVIVNESESRHVIELHGPGGPAVLQKIADDGAVIESLENGHRVLVQVAGCSVEVMRLDVTGETGLQLRFEVSDAPKIRKALDEVEGLPWRWIGWHAFNIARIEAGTPLFNVDYGSDSLPHETGVLNERVSFTKGCYLGQEVVARMQNLGHPPKKLVGLRLTGDAIPVTGAPVIDPDAKNEKSAIVGAVTSAAPSPMLSGSVIAFAMVKYALAKDGQELAVRIDDETVGTVVGGLRFWGAASGVQT